MSDDAFRKSILKILAQHQDISAKTCKKFCEFFSYQQGLFQDAKAYRALANTLKARDDNWGVCSNKLFYLAVPPQQYETIFKNLARSGLTRPCSAEEGWSRVLVEKPFGKNRKTAERLDLLLGNLFKEIQIYRIGAKRKLSETTFFLTSRRPRALPCA